MAEVNPDIWVDQYGDYLFRYAKSRLRNANAAEEVVQETFLAGVRYSEQFAGRGSERGWLMGILKRKIVDHIRVRMKHNKATSYEDEHDPSEQLFDANGNWKSGAINWSPSPGQQIEMEELQALVQDCMQSLPENQAAVFVLSVMEELDSDDICRELEITPANMWVRMHRARVGLAKCVGAKWHVGEEAKQHVK
ncbi:sigma-70 family RNA polymerase sigma factor [Mariniblastus fucicola]|uniref:RNA polymerase sigma factor SigM n=1 Tax=Mariniblastus fucicola TaxID=980251 RepID=A0A5B9P9J8_9BACT|nr:sigma-70 family RNA polymerase sigma factor [Mariniblastus fucicola]QEG21622.1 RNA polymerase sigma factor SigM [Mariniblastus fucicola]